jgi:hypothetical protein
MLCVELKNKLTGNPYFNMKPFLLTEEDKNYIRKNYLNYSQRVLGEKLNCSRETVRRVLLDENLVVPSSVIGKFRKQRNAELRKNNECIKTPPEDNGTYKDMLKYAKKIGFKNIAQAFKEKGRKSFITEFKAIK